MRKMIFHAPFALEKEPKSASMLRPVLLREAFAEAGYRVFDLSGTPVQRRRRLRALKQLLAAGEKFDFCYSESATIPNAVAGKKHFPPHLLLEPQIFWTLRQAGIPTGHFYRDIYWKFPEYKKSVPSLIYPLMLGAYYFDLLIYRACGVHLFVPSEKMGDLVPLVKRKNISALPPGGKISAHASSDCADTLLYIGAVGGHYGLAEVFAAFARIPQQQLILCTGEDGWLKFRDQVEVPSNVHVVHRSGEELQQLYESADLCSLFVKPDPYREFAVPVKLFEYLANGKPIVATAGTLAAQFVEENQIGWVIPYTADALVELLQQLHHDPTKYAEAAEQTQRVRKQHTWLARAQQAAQILTKDGE